MSWPGLALAVNQYPVSILLLETDNSCTKTCDILKENGQYLGSIKFEVPILDSPPYIHFQLSIFTETFNLCLLNTSNISQIEKDFDQTCSQLFCIIIKHFYRMMSNSSSTK